MILEFQQKRLRDIPFYESYRLRDDGLDLAQDYARELAAVTWEWYKGKASTKQLDRTIIRALYAVYLRGRADEREQGPVMELPGDGKQHGRIKKYYDHIAGTDRDRRPDSPGHTAGDSGGDS